MQMSRIWRTCSWWRVCKSRWTPPCWTTRFATTHSKPRNSDSYFFGFQRSGQSASRQKTTCTTSTWMGTCPITTFSLRCCMPKEPELQPLGTETGGGGGGGGRGQKTQYSELLQAMLMTNLVLKTLNFKSIIIKYLIANKWYQGICTANCESKAAYPPKDSYERHRNGVDWTYRGSPIPTAE